jgi:hypothetical protein
MNIFKEVFNFTIGIVFGVSLVIFIATISIILFG